MLLRGSPDVAIPGRNASSGAECSGEVALFGKARVQRDIHQSEATIRQAAAWRSRCERTNATDAVLFRWMS